ncbi:MAG: NAD(P)H-binding protein [Bacteroidota bacterium]
MENQKRALIAGGSGLIGKALCKILVKDSYYQQVFSLVRRTQAQSPQGLTEQVVDFDTLESLKLNIKIDDAFCCLGTTMKKAGSKAAFYKVDFEYVTHFARLALANEAKRFFLVSSMGANASSMVYYNRIKGEIETAIKNMPFQSVHIFRPSLLLGNRQEQRIGEDIGKFLAQTFDFLIPAKYKGITGEQVAKAMFAKAQDKKEGHFIHESDTLRKI